MPDARVQRGSRLHLARFAHHVRRAPPHHLRLLRLAARRNGVERLALGGSSQGGLYQAVRSQKPISGVGGRGGPHAELWGAPQWQLLKERHRDSASPRSHRRSTSRRPSPSLTGSPPASFEGMLEALGPELVWPRSCPPRALPVDFIASRLPGGGSVLPPDLQRLVWKLIDEMYSSRTIKPGVTRTSDLVWWWRQRRERPRTRHLVPALDRSAAEGRHRRSSWATIRSSSAAMCCTATSASPRSG